MVKLINAAKYKKITYILLEIAMKTMTQLQNYNECLILKVIETLFRYRAVSTTSDLGLVSGGIDTK